MKKLLLVDGSNLLFQMFFGMPSRIVNAAGKPIHGTLGFVGALLKIMRMVAPTHAAVLFDGEHGTERNILSADFKALVGDSADNLRGAAGVGPKTAAALIGQFGSLGELLGRKAEIQKPSVRASVSESAARIALNYRLVKLDDRARLPFEPDYLACDIGGITTSEVLRGIGLR